MVHTTRQFYILVTMILISLGVLAWQSSATRRFVTLEPTVMAFVDIQNVFNSLEERAKLFSDSEAFSTQLQDEVITKRHKITDIDSEIELYKEGSSKRKELEQKQKLDTLEYDVFIECCKSKLQRLKRGELEACMTIYGKASAKLAKKKWLGCRLC